MVYTLFISLVILFSLNYFFSGRDFFAPATVQLLSFAVTVFMCIYFMMSMDCFRSFHLNTVIIIVTAMSLSALIGIGIHLLVSRIKIHSHTPESVAVSPISDKASFLFVSILLLTVVWLLIEIRRIGGTSGGFAAIMHHFHSLNSYSVEEDGRLPWLLNQFISLAYVLFVLYGFNLIRFFRQLSVWRRTVNLFVLLLCGVTLLLTGARGGIVNNFLACLVMFHLLRIQRQGGYKQYSFKFVFRMAALLVGIMAVFFLAKSFVGRTSENETMNMADYISYYVGAGYITLDSYFQNPPAPSNIFGKETFYRLISFLTRYGLTDIPPYIAHLEFRPVGAGFRTNVYTSLRSYHYDFGLSGMYLLHGISLLFLSVFYEYVKKKRGNRGILIFSLMYYTIVMSFFAERFYSNLFSMNFLKMAFMLLVLYELLIRKRLRFRLGDRY